jgi:Holliday junction DNA helicase RuvA
MFYYVRGELVLAEPGTAVIECGGVGYKLSISDNTLGKLSNMDKKSALLYTYMNVREDAVDLIGFATKDELSVFKMLISVSGVGPKAAMSILSHLSAEKFALAVCTEDKKTIAKANGVGPKTAARIILELKDKLMKEHAGDDFSALGAEASPATGAGSKRGLLSEATDALLVLGYSRAEAANVLKDIPTEKMELEEIIRTSLKKLVKY